MRWVVGTLLILYLLVLIVLWAPPIRHAIAERASAWLTREVGAKVSVGDFEVGLFNRLVLHDVVIEDRQGREMLRSGTLAAKIGWRELAEGEVRLRSVSLLDTRASLRRDSLGGPTNFQFLVDYFETEEKKEPTRLNLRVGSLILRRVAVSWDEVFAAETPNVFNPSHLHFADIDANISLRRLTTDSLNLRLRHLSLREECGLEVRRLSVEVEANRSATTIRNLVLQLPHSNVKQREVVLGYDGHKDFSTLAKTLHAKGKLEEIQVDTRDIACFLPRLHDFPTTLSLATHYDIAPSHFRFRHLQAHTDDGGLSVQGNVSFEKNGQSITHIDAQNVQLHASILSMRQLFERIVRKPMPAPIAAAGGIDFQGDVAADLNKLYKVKGTLQTQQAGHVRADVIYAVQERKASGEIEADNVMLAQLLNDKELPTGITAKIKGSATLPQHSHPNVVGDVQLAAMTWRGYTLRDVSVEGSWTNGQLIADIISHDPSFDLTASLRAAFDGHTLGRSNLQASVHRLYPAALGLSAGLGESVFSGDVKADLPQLVLPPQQASFLLQNFAWTGREKPLNIQLLSLQTEPTERGNRIDLLCDAGEVHIDGPFDPKTAYAAVRKVVERSLPGLWMADTPAQAPDGEWLIDATITDTRLLHEQANIPLTFDGPLRINGNLRSDGGRMVLLAQADGLSYDSVQVLNPSIYLTGEGDEVRVLAQATKPLAHSDMRLALDLKARSGVLRSQLSWRGGNDIVDNGKLNVQTTYLRTPEGLSIEANVLPSEVILAGDTWNISAGRVNYANKEVAVSGIAVGREDQGIRIDGRFSSNPQDSIVAQLRNVNIPYVLNLVEFDDVEFAGLATGQMSVSRATGSPQIRADIHVPDFYFNDGPMGRLALRGGFDPTQKRINLDGHMEHADSGHTDVVGYVDLGEKRLNLDIGANNTNLRFLREYIDGIFSDFEGRATGNALLYGPFKALDFHGDLKAKAEAMIPATGVRYHIRDGEVHARPGSFAFENFTIAGEHRGTGSANGILRHNHLKNISYDFTFQANDLQLYNQPRLQDMPFFATAYGDGSAHLFGSPGQFEADITMTTRKGTSLTYTLGRSDTYASQDFVTFKKKENEESKEEKEEEEEAPSTTDIRLNMQINATPEAALHVVMDEKTGDHIDLKGNGNLRALFYNKGRFQLFGTYAVEEGLYKMSIQDIIRKDFTLQRGGRITFSGEPYQGDLDLQAIYTVNSASLSDLGLGTGFSQNSVRVNCLLGFSGKVENPQVSFDFDLPTVNEEEKRLVRNLISTEEDMTTQVLYLLGIGRFYSYNSTQTSSAGTSAAGAQSAAAMKSFLAGTISSQLNDIIQNAVGSNNWTFGANVSTGTAGTNDMEVEGLLSGRLFNNRLLVNGNIGYRDNSIYSNNFIGDFDVQYLLTRGGSVRLKAYSETNDRYFTKSALTTQGVGIQLSRDFSSLKDLFTIKKKKKKTKKTKE